MLYRLRYKGPASRIRTTRDPQLLTWLAQKCHTQTMLCFLQNRRSFPLHHCLSNPSYRRTRPPSCHEETPCCTRRPTKHQSSPQATNDDSRPYYTPPTQRYQIDSRRSSPPPRRSRSLRNERGSGLMGPTSRSHTSRRQCPNDTTTPRPCDLDHRGACPT